MQGNVWGMAVAMVLGAVVAGVVSFVIDLSLEILHCMLPCNVVKLSLEILHCMCNVLFFLVGEYFYWR
jgi:large-conductance mechanosensitive channel